MQNTLVKENTVKKNKVRQKSRDHVQCYRCPGGEETRLKSNKIMQQIQTSLYPFKTSKITGKTRPECYLVSNMRILRYRNQIFWIWLRILFNKSFWKDLFFVKVGFFRI